LYEAGDAASFDAPEHRRDPVLCRLDDAHDFALDTDTIKVSAGRFLHVRVFLGSDQQVDPLAWQALDQPQRRQASDLHGHDAPGKSTRFRSESRGSDREPSGASSC